MVLCLCMRLWVFSVPRFAPSLSFPSFLLSPSHPLPLFQCPHLFQEALTESSAIADARLPDCPLVWVNDFFEKLTHYPKEDIIGKNCRFLQGPLTDRETVRSVSKAIKNGKPLDVDILNYRFVEESIVLVLNTTFSHFFFFP